MHQTLEPNPKENFCLGKILYSIFIILHFIFLASLCFCMKHRPQIALYGNLFFLFCLVVLCVCIYNDKKIGFEFLDKKIGDYGNLSFIVFHSILLLLINILGIAIIFSLALENGYEFSSVINAEGLTYISAIGGFIGGVIGPLISLVASLLVFVTLKLQSKQIKDAQKAIADSYHLDTIPYLFTEYEQVKVSLNSLISDYAKRNPEKSLDFFCYMVFSYRNILEIKKNSNIDKQRFIFYELFPKTEGQDFEEKKENAEKQWIKLPKEKFCFKTFLDIKRKNEESFKIFCDQYISICTLIILHLKFSETTDQVLLNYQQLFLKKMTSYEICFHLANQNNTILEPKIKSMFENEIEESLKQEINTHFILTV